MPKFSFEKMHRNHKWAFLDGFLCGVAVMYYGRLFYKDYQEDKAFRESAVRIEVPTQTETTN